MSANIVNTQNSAAYTLTTTYTPPQLLGLMTGGMLVAILSIAVTFRLIQSFSAIRRYETAAQRVIDIESKLDELRRALEKAELEYTKGIADLDRAHEKEMFELEQMIFNRNNEILDLKNKLLQINKNGPL